MADHSVAIKLTNKLSHTAHTLVEYRPQLLENEELQHLSICLISPKFEYVPNSEKSDHRILRAPQTFLSSKVIQKIEELKQNSFYKSNDPFDESYRSPRRDVPQRNIIVLLINLQELTISEICRIN